MARILVIGPAWVGDMVMAQSLFMALKEREPDVEIHVVAPGWSLPLAARMPEVTKGWGLDVGHGALGLGARRALAERLRAAGFDRAIVLPNSLKAALVPFLAGIRKRRGYRGEWRYGLVNDMRRDTAHRAARTVDRFVALATDDPRETPPPARHPRLAVDRASALSSARALGLDDATPAVALCPGAEYGPAKQWPPGRFAELAARLLADGHAVWLVGGPNDRTAADAIRAALPAGTPRLIDLTGRTSLDQAIDVLSLARAVVTNDSGLMHVAAALDRPLVAIYGSSSPDVTPPLSDKAAIVAHALDCRPCFQRTCPLGHLACLNGISADEVAAALALAPAGAESVH